VAKSDNVDLRLRLRNHLAQFIEKILIYSEGFAAEYAGQGAKEEAARTKILRNRKQWPAMTPEERQEYRKPRPSDEYETVADYLTGVMENPEPGFVEYVVKARMSKRGRFVRVFFKGGIWRDLVPEKSLATGFKLYLDEDRKPQWKKVDPPWESLWKEYQKSQK
jgi:hypothetical protein